MISKSFQIINKNGLHARPAALFVQLCSKYKSDINIHKENSSVNAKSIIGVLALGVGFGSIVEIAVDGQDEKEAMDSIANYLNNDILKFD